VTQCGVVFTNRRGKISDKTCIFMCGTRKNSKAVLLNPRATGRVGVIGQSPVNREGISHEKPEDGRPLGT